MTPTRLVHRGRFLDKFPAVAEAACAGVLSAGQITALKVSCPTPVEPIMAAQQVEMVAIVAALSVADTETAASLWRQRAEALVELPEPVEPDRELRTARTADGLVGRFVLDDAGAVQFEQAIRHSLDLGRHRRQPRTALDAVADALVDVCAFFNANHDRPGTPRQRPHVELNVDADTLTERRRWRRPAITPRSSTHVTADALLCDCVIHRVQRAGNAILSYGRATRTVPVDLFRATAARDGGCRFPGCDRKVAWCDAHHIHYWRHLGLTELENLVLLCNRHHHQIHRPGWHLKLLPNADLEVTFPDGTTPHQPTPRPTPRPTNPTRPMTSRGTVRGNRVLPAHPVWTEALV